MLKHLKKFLYVCSHKYDQLVNYPLNISKNMMLSYYTRKYLEQYILKFHFMTKFIYICI